MRRGLEPRPRYHRDARLFVIAVEGERMEPWYFEGLEGQGIVGGRRIKVALLPTQAGQSSPGHVRQRLEEFRTDHKLRVLDQLWMVVDVDKWKALEGELAAADREGLGVAVSNPCFEVWLQLHFVDSPEARDGTAGSAKRAWGELREDKAGSAAWPFTRDHVQDAVKRGTAADSGGWVPALPGSHVHRLVGELLRYS